MYLGLGLGNEGSDGSRVAKALAAQQGLCVEGVVANQCVAAWRGLEVLGNLGIVSDGEHLGLHASHRHAERLVQHSDE